MDLNTATQYTMDLPNFHAEVTKVDGTRLIMQGPCVRQTNSEYPETWHQDYRVGKLVVIPKQGEPGFLVFSYQTMYEVSGRSALNKQPKVMTKTSGTEAPMTSVACVEPSNRIGLRVLEQYTCESLAKVEDQHTREEYWRYEEPLHKGWLPEKGIQISPEAYAEVEALSTELPAYQKAKKELFAKAREAGLFSTCVPKGLGVVDRQERGHIGYEGVGGSWMRVTLPEHHVSLVTTDFSLGGYSGAVRTNEVVAGDSMRQPFP